MALPPIVVVNTEGAQSQGATMIEAEVEKCSELEAWRCQRQPFWPGANYPGSLPSRQQWY